MSLPSSSNRWCRRYRPAEHAAVRLVCFPHAGGSATFYFPVSRALSPEIDVLAIQYPGRQDRRTESCVDSIGELADIIAAHLEPLADKPITLFGHSMGAMIAFETSSSCPSSSSAAVTPAIIFTGMCTPLRFYGDLAVLPRTLFAAFSKQVAELG